MPDAELSSITTTLEELARRIENLAAAHEKNGEADAVDLYEVERSLNASVRRLTKLVSER